MSWPQMEGISDVYYAGQLEENYILAKRVKGGKEPENKTLGALLLNEEQASLLLQVVEQYNQAFKFDEIEPQTMLGHIHESLNVLHALCQTARVEKNEV